MEFIVAASRAISSSPGGIDTRWVSAVVEMSSTSRRMASTGRSARPITHHEMSDVKTMTDGSTKMNNCKMSRRVVLVTSRVDAAA